MSRLTFYPPPTALRIVVINFFVNPDALYKEVLQAKG
jgi:hypothetical protein